MDIVFLVYGAAFLILGIAILVQPKRTSTFKFAPQLWLLAGFGLFHGANEWLDLLKLLHGPTTFLKVTSLCFLITSYGLLFEFGRRLVKMSTRGNTAIVTTLSPGIYLPIVGVLLVTGLTSEYPWINLDILFRYFFGFSSALLTGYGLFLYYQYEKQRIGTLKLRTNFVWAAAIFVTYGVLSGLVVQKADYFPANWLNYDSFMEYVHLPVQIARAITAILAAVFITRILTLFNWEADNNLKAMIEKLQLTLQNTEHLRHQNNLILEATGEGIIGVDDNGNCTFLNTSAQRILGYTAMELMGKSVCSVVRFVKGEGHSYREVECPIIMVVQNGNSFRLEDGDLLRKNGTVIPVECFASPIIENGNHSGAVVTIRDISQRRETLLALKESEERFRALVESSSDWIWEVDRNGRYVYASPMVKKLLGYEPEEVLGKTPFDLMPPDEAERIKAIFSAIVDAKKAIVALENVNRHKNGKLVILETSGVPIFDARGNLTGYRGMDRDITERRRSEEVLRNSKSSLDEAQRIARLGNWDWEIKQDKLVWSAEIYRIFGLSPEKFDTTFEKFLACVHPEDKNFVAKSVDEALYQHKPYNLVHRLIRPDGEERVVHEYAEVTYDEQGVPVRMIGTVQDVTEQRRAEAELRLAARVFENTSEGVIITDPNLRIVAINKAFTTITGYEEDEVIGKTTELFKSGHHAPEFYNKLWASIAGTDHWQGEVCNRRKNGELYPEWLNISTVRDENDKIINYIGVFSDITSIKQSQQKLDYLAHHDTLTGLPNRLLFSDRLNQALARAQRSGKSVAVLFLDIDRFKIINDTLGHDYGDKLLQTVAQRITTCVRREDTVARIGGDEFCLIQEGVIKPEDAAVMAGKLLDCASKRFTIEAHELTITASIGISLYPQDGENIHSLIKNADAAMYRAKDYGRNTYQYYKPEMTKTVSERLALECALHGALERHEISLYYQPQVNLSDGSIIGMESLLRWHHPEMGMIPPARFIPVAEDSGLIHILGEWVFKTACHQAAAWQAAGFPPIPVAVNVSGRQITLDHVVEKARSALQESGLDPKYLEVEVTESVLMEDTGKAVATLNALKELGITLSIDDFGTGYSSLSYLKRFPIDKLKIDKSFIDGVPDDKDDVAIVAAIIAMAHSLNMKVIAEGVETEQQINYLRYQGCDEMQGYLYSQPLPAQEIEQLMHKECLAKHEVPLHEEAIDQAI